MKKALIFLIILIIISAVFAVAFGLYEVKFFNSRADVSQASFSVDNSYIFSTPSQARANGQEKIRLTVFVLNSQGIGVLGKKISFSSNQDLSIETIQGLTDGYGKAFFDISSIKPADYYLDVLVDGTALNQKAHITFN